MTALPHTRAAAVILVDGKGRVLITERPAYKPVMPGYWEFPGGKLENGETPEACMAREAQEEIGVTPLAYEPLHVIEETRLEGTPDAYRVTVHVYLCRQWEGEITPKEQQRMAWVIPDRLCDYRLLPANLSLAGYLCRWLLPPVAPG